MNKTILTVLGLAALPILANTPPAITNVRASQREGTKLVDIYYDAADADNDLLKVRVEISDNDGARYSVPAFSLRLATRIIVQMPPCFSHAGSRYCMLCRRLRRRARGCKS